MTKFFDILLIVFVVISVGSYFEVKNIKENMPNKFAYQTHYWGDNKAPDSDLKTDPDVNFTFVVNYYANKDNSGVELYEIKLNYYSDYKLQNIYSLGLQIVNPNLKFSVGLDESDWSVVAWVDTNYYFSYDVDFDALDKNYYATDDGVSFTTTTSFNGRNVPYIIKIDDKPYAFDFNKKTTEVISHNAFWGSTTYGHFISDFDYFLYKIYDSTTHITNGDGVYEHLVLELEDVFNIYEYNEKTGKFDILSTFGYDVDYVSFKVNYHETGAKRHEHSLFNQIGDKTGGVVWAN